jgi:hypothetical protein
MTDPGNENSTLDILRRNRDDFDKQISLGTTNEADLASHYPFTPERFRVSKNGTRQFIQYGSVPEFTDTVDTHEITPQSAGDVVTFRTAEQVRYVVQYVLEWSLSLALTQPLQAGEIMTVGFGDADLANTTDNTPGPNADGWIVYQNGSMDTTEAVLGEFRNGTAVDEIQIEFENLFQTFGRLGGKTNWYNVGPTTIEESYTQDGQQLNEELGAVSVDDGKGPATANNSIEISLKAEAGAGNLTAEIGSIGLRTVGDISGIVRTKRSQIANQTVGATGVFVPIAAFRVAPDKVIVSANLTDVTPTNYTGGGALKLVAFAVDPSKTDATGFTSPPETSAVNSVIEQTTNVTTMPDATGTVTTNPADPGGFQLGFGSLQSNKNQSGSPVSLGKIRKRLISQNDIAIVTAFVPTSGSTGDVTFEYGVEQDF